MEQKEIVGPANNQTDFFLVLSLGILIVVGIRHFCRAFAYRTKPFGISERLC